MAAESTWLPAWNAQIQYNTKYLECSKLSSRDNFGEFPTTNNRGQGWTEFGVSNRTKEINFTCPVSDENAADLPKKSDLVDATWEDVEGSHAGKFRITTMNRDGGGEGGYSWTYTGKFTGPVVLTPPTP